MKRIKDNSVSLIFADAPYNIGKDFGTNRDKWENVDTYIEWCKQWIDECMRVLKADGTMYFMTATQHMPYLDIYVSEKYNVLCRIVWTYDSSGVQSKKMYGSLYEPILMINKSEKAKYTFNYHDIMVEAKTCLLYTSIPGFYQVACLTASHHACANPCYLFHRQFSFFF